MLGLGLGLTSPAILGATGPAYEAEAQTLFAAWSAAGAPASDADKARANTLIAALKSAGLWSGMAMLHVYPVHAAAAARINWKTPGTHNATIVGAPTFTAYAGYSTDGVDDGIYTINPSGVLAQDSFYVGIWLTDAARSTTSHYGWYDGTDGITINARYTTDEIQVRASVTGADVGVVTGITTAAGLTAVNRSGAAATQCYRNGAAQTMTNATAASVALNNSELRVGVASGTFSAAHPLFVVAGASLNAAGHLALYNALNAYRPWSPMDLGANLKVWINADDTVNGTVATLTDRVGGLVVTAAAGVEPISAATSFNSAYRGLTFDGVDDYLTTSVITMLPTGATAGEIWSAASNATAGATAGANILCAYGGTSGATIRRLQRTPVTSTNRAGPSDGTGALTDTVIDYSGAHIVGAAWSGTTMTGRIDGRDMSPASTVIATLATSAAGRFRIGGSSAATAALFWSGVVSDIIVTLTLTATEREKLEGWLAHNRGLTSLLPSGHPYKSVAP